MLLSICQGNNKCAVLKGHSLQFDAAELKAFIGILLARVYVQFPRRWKFWSASDDCNNTAVVNCMTRSKFEEILSFLHVADKNALDM